jgi:hypothetical protein
MKWGQRVQEELRYLMPLHTELTAGPVFLLHSLHSRDHGIFDTWGPQDRMVQASDLYANWGQVRCL